MNRMFFRGVMNQRHILVHCRSNKDIAHVKSYQTQELCLLLCDRSVLCPVLVAQCKVLRKTQLFVYYFLNIGCSCVMVFNAYNMVCKIVSVSSILFLVFPVLIILNIFICLSFLCLLCSETHSEFISSSASLGGGRVVRWCWVTFQCRGVLQI